LGIKKFDVEKVPLVIETGGGAALSDGLLVLH
jgi:hypothetical protein